MSEFRKNRRRVHQSILERFRGRPERGYVWSKLGMDPLYGGAARALNGSHMPLLDIGCGMGLFGMFLSEHGRLHDYLGVDNDARKLETGRAIARDHYPDINFHECNAASLPRFQGNVVLLDLLHYLPRTDQAPVLAAAAERVAPGGMLLVRNCVRDRSWRYHVTRFEEVLLHRSRWMKTPAGHYPTREEVEKPLREAGLRISMQPLWGLTPFNSYLFVAVRDQAASG